MATSLVDVLLAGKSRKVKSSSSILEDMSSSRRHK
jgi:hypothetical protein